MKINMLLAMVGLGLCSRVHGSSGSLDSPDCVSKCWDNSKFVTICVNETKCLCEDGDFQSAVFQCLYSQCPTAQFGSALHVALSECSSYSTGGSAPLPHLIRQQGLRKRDNYRSGYVSGSGVGPASVSAVHSILRRSASVSAIFTSRPSRSVSYGMTHTHKLLNSQPTSSAAKTGIPTTLSPVQNSTFVLA